MKLSTYAPVGMSVIFIIFLMIFALIFFAFNPAWHRNLSHSEQNLPTNKSFNNGQPLQSDAISPPRIP